VGIAAWSAIAAIPAGNGHMTFVFPNNHAVTGHRRRSADGHGGGRARRADGSRAEEEEDGRLARGDSAVQVASEVTAPVGGLGEGVTAQAGLVDERAVTAPGGGLVVREREARVDGLEQKGTGTEATKGAICVGILGI